MFKEYHSLLDFHTVNMEFCLEDIKRASQKEKDCVFGYLRRTQKELNSVIIPMIVYHICTIYCMIYDKWDREWTHSAYDIIDDYILRQSSVSSNSTTAFLSTILDTGTLNSR